MYYKSKDKYILCTDDARFINHSKTPNTHGYYGKKGDLTIATFDIKKGEELTEDYTTWDSEDPNIDF